MMILLRLSNPAVGACAYIPTYGQTHGSQASYLTCAMHLAMRCRSAKEMEGTVSWPPAPTQQAVLLRQQCARMIADLRAVGQGYKAAVIALQGALPQPEAAPAAPAPPPTPAPAEAEKEEGAAGQADAGAEAAPAPAAPAPSPLEAAHAAATSLERELGNAVGCAVSRVEEGFRGLLYSVLLRELVTHIATDAEPA